MIQTVISYINLCFSALYKKMKLSKVIICQKSKKSKVIFSFHPMKCVKKPPLLRLFHLHCPTSQENTRKLSASVLNMYSGYCCSVLPKRLLVIRAASMRPTGRQPSKLILSVLYKLGEIFRKFPLISFVFFDKVVQKTFKLP